MVLLFHAGDYLYLLKKKCALVWIKGGSNWWLCDFPHSCRGGVRECINM